MTRVFAGPIGSFTSLTQAEADRDVLLGRGGLAFLRSLIEEQKRLPFVPME